jgi:hypothetical protein
VCLYFCQQRILHRGPEYNLNSVALTNEVKLLGLTFDGKLVFYPTYSEPKTEMSESLSAWLSGLGRAPSCFTAREFDGSLVQTPGADMVNQAVHPSGVGKLVAISLQ